MMLKIFDKNNRQKGSLPAIKKVAFALTLVASAAFFAAGCSKDDAKKTSDNKDVATSMDGSKENNVAAVANDETVFVIDDTNITAAEARWYVYMLADSIKEDVKAYENETGKSYYEAIANDEGQTVEEALRTQVVDMVYYYEIMYKHALTAKDYKIEDNSFFEEEAEKKMEEVGQEAIEEYSLTKEAYATILRKWTLADMYYDEVAGLYDVDKDELMKNTYSQDEIKELSDDEYGTIANELDRNYRRQLFNEDFEELQKDHQIQVINDKWKSIQIHD